MKIKDPEVEVQEKQALEDKSLSNDDMRRESKRLQDQQARFDKGVNLAETLSNMVNSMCADDEQRGFFTAMKRTHRTLQQSSFQLFLAWTYYIAQEYKDIDIDLRNEYMVKTAKKLKECLGDYGYSLPFI